MNNFDVLKQMPLKEFANMVFNVAKYDCKSLEEFEAILNREIPVEMEGEFKEALQKMQLSNAKTRELLEELKTREGVETKYAEPHQDKEVSVNGPAVILIVTD